MKSTSILLFLFLAAFSSCQKSELGAVSSSQPLTYKEMVEIAESQGFPISKIGLKRNWNEVLAIADIYGLKDRFKDQERENNGLMFMGEDNLHTYFQEEKLTRE
ncbi:MAG: hypothetical protein ABIO24_07660, partial [Saprospiraceae bacterium]